MMDDNVEDIVFDFEDKIELIKSERFDGDIYSNKRKSRKTVVCKYWLSSLCMRGDACEYLHQVKKLVRWCFRIVMMHPHFGGVTV